MSASTVRTVYGFLLTSAWFAFAPPPMQAQAVKAPTGKAPAVNPPKANTPAIVNNTPTNKDSAILQDFKALVAAYIKLRKGPDVQAPKLKPTKSAEIIADKEHALTDAIRSARSNAKQGDIFTPEIAAEFRRLSKIAMQGQNAVRVHQTLKSAEPVQVPLKVNDTYPTTRPLQSMPPTLLLNFPQLPKELEYRLVGKTLVLRDIDANLIVDFLPEAIP